MIKAHFIGGPKDAEPVELSGTYPYVDIAIPPRFTMAESGAGGNPRYEPFHYERYHLHQLADGDGTPIFVLAQPGVKDVVKRLLDGYLKAAGGK